MLTLFSCFRGHPMILWLLICIHLNICIDPVQSKKEGSVQLCGTVFKGISSNIPEDCLLCK